ncbi:MAG TPA: ABC transporter permease [Gammaproteobacteria bacterium]|nr:ABC transporter permease [Gammaproteobacteria bacterium]
MAHRLQCAAMSLLADLLRDFRYAARALARTPGFTVVALTVLALGIGANSAIFSLVSAVWLRPLPFADAERLVTLWTDLTAVGGPPRVEISPGNYSDWQQRARSFESMAPLEVATFSLTGDGAEPERLTGVRTSSNLFATIGQAPLLGRTFVPEDGTGEPVAVVSEGFWLRRLSGDPAAVGRTITLDGSPHTVVGVVPRDFRFPGESDVFVPTTWSPEVLARDASYYWYLVAKLRPDVSLEAARAELATISAALRDESPNTGRGVAVTVLPLRESLARGIGFAGPFADSSGTLFALLGAVALVLLIGCANVANLILTRATARQKELAIRKALGAARGRVLRQLLAESILLAGASVVVGLAIAVACFGYLSRLLPGTLPASATMALDSRVLALTIAAAIVTVLLFGVGPAFAAASRDFSAAFGRAVGAHGKQARRLRTTLVVAEIALTVVLLTGAGLLLRSYTNVLAVDPGVDADGVLVAETVLPEAIASNAAQRAAFYRRVLEELRALPGVESAGYTSFAPLLFKGGRSVVFIDGRPRPERAEMLQHTATNRSASPGYFEALGVPLVSGRFIDERDVRGSQRVVVINESLARAYWPEGDPIGQRLSMGGGEMMTVIGVVGDVRQLGLDVPADRELFMPIDQIDGAFMAPRQLVVRTNGDPLALAAAVRRAVWAVDANQPVSNVRAMSEVLDAELANRDTQLTLLGAFAAIALVLAAVGLYGVLSYTVAQSTNEIGLRMALGAQQRTVVGTVVRSALGAALTGVGVGLVVAYALTRTIASFLYGVSPTDPMTAVAVAGVLLLVAGLAAFVPALRAARVNPLTALRAEA